MFNWKQEINIFSFFHNSWNFHEFKSYCTNCNLSKVFEIRCLNFCFDWCYYIYLMKLGLVCTDANDSWTTHILSFYTFTTGSGGMHEWLLYWSVYNGSKLQALLDKNSKKANLINLLLCRSCLWSCSVWNKSGWNWERLSEFILNPAHSLCTICEWTRRVSLTENGHFAAPFLSCGVRLSLTGWSCDLLVRCTLHRGSGERGPTGRMWAVPRAPSLVYPCSSWLMQSDKYPLHCPMCSTCRHSPSEGT